jgi:hypothetical protein
MIRGGRRSGRIARVVGVVVALAVAAPAAAGAQSAVDEYSLDLPGGGTDSGDSGTPSSGAPSAGGTSSGTPTDTSSGDGTPTDTSSGGGTPTDTSSGGGAGLESRSGGDGGKGDASRGAEQSQSQDQRSDELEFSGIHDGGSNALDTNSRSVPEVVADTLLDGPMLPILAALVLITGFGAWRVLRSRGTLTRHAG